ncbi:MAG: MFS transporter [Actinomycetota bacterium]|nr:MFS transporter [Actinomycetota bacterium]
MRAPRPDDPADDPPRDPTRWWTLGVLCLSLTLVMLSNASMNVALPSIARELDASSSELQWIVDAYALVFAGLLFAAGTIGDRFGRKRALQLGLVLFLVAAAGGAFATTSAQVIAVRAVMGVGAAFVMPSTLSIIANVFDAEERPQAISTWAGISAGAAALGPPVSGLLLQHFWWGSVFLLTAPIAFIALVAGHRLVPPSRDPDGTRLDLGGVALSILAASALVYAVVEAPHNGWLSTSTVVVGAVGVGAVIGFVAVERRTTHPMLELGLFRDPHFSVPSAGIAMLYFTTFGVFFLLTQVFQLVHGMTPVEAGLMILPVSLVLTVVSPRAPRLVRRFGASAVVTSGLVGVAVALLAMSRVAGQGTVWWFIPVLMAWAAGMAVTITPLTTLIMGAVPPNRAGMGSAMNDATREMGGALGVAVLGSVASTLYLRGLPPLGSLRPPVIAEARRGLAGTLEAATEPGAPAGLAAAARDAFVDAFAGSLVVGAAMAAVAAVLASRYLRAAGTARADDRRETGHPRPSASAEP